MSDESRVQTSRRALLGAALGGAAAVAATSLRPLDVNAATGDNVLLGKGTVAGENTADAPTIVTNVSAGQVSLSGVHAADGTGVRGLSSTGPGVMGGSGDITNADDTLTETGVYGYTDSSFGATGVYGESYQGIGVMGAADWGVYGLAGSAGVVGDADTLGLGVMGISASLDGWPTAFPQGVGVWAVAGSTSQTALQVSGKLKLSRSGRKSIGSTKTSLKVTMAGVTTSSYIIATMQTNVSGVYVRAVVPASGYFTIYLSKAPGKTVYVGFMVIN